MKTDDTTICSGSNSDKRCQDGDGNTPKVRAGV